jgi:hypothetical protein
MIKAKKHGRIAAKKMHNRQYGQYSKMANHYLLEQQDMGLLNFIFIHIQKITIWPSITCICTWKEHYDK